MQTHCTFFKGMTVASCLACIVLGTTNAKACEQPTEVNNPAYEAQPEKKFIHDTTVANDTTAARIVEHPRWNIGTNLLEWTGVMPDLKYTTWGANIHGEYYFKKQYSVRLTAAYSEHHYSHGKKFQGFTSYVLEPRYWFSKDATFCGFFGGVYGQLGDYNDVNPDRKYTGHFWGAGLSAGYLYPVWKGLAVEFNVRAGYRSTEIKKYVYNDAGDRCLCQRIDKNGLALTGFALNISWRF